MYVAHLPGDGESISLLFNSTCHDSGLITLPGDSESVSLLLNCTLLDGNLITLPGDSESVCLSINGTSIKRLVDADILGSLREGAGDVADGIGNACGGWEISISTARNRHYQGYLQAPGKFESNTGAVAYSQTMAREEASPLTKWHCSGMSDRAASAIVEAFSHEFVPKRAWGRCQLTGQWSSNCEGGHEWQESNDGRGGELHFDGFEVGKDLLTCLTLNDNEIV